MQRFEWFPHTQLMSYHVGVPQYHPHMQIGWGWNCTPVDTMVCRPYAWVTDYSQYDWPFALEWLSAAKRQ